MQVFSNYRQKNFTHLILLVDSVQSYPVLLILRLAAEIYIMFKNLKFDTGNLCTYAFAKIFTHMEKNIELSLNQQNNSIWLSYRFILNGFMISGITLFVLL